jgi:8-oxo-dGTP pyrophosphatase MutT (NUDIX family)
MEINCSVTVMPVYEDEQGVEVGFIRRVKEDTFGGLLVAPGGKVEPTDGVDVHGVMYWSVEHAARRELLEETGISCELFDPFYFCSLTLPNGRVVISLYLWVKEKPEKLEWYSREEIMSRQDFAPGMKEEAAMLIDKLYG